MLSGHNILCFPPNRWEGLWRNRQQIMSRLAAHNRILYIHAPHDLRQLAAYRSRPHALLAGPRLSSPLPNLWVYEPPRYAPRSGRAPLRQITLRLRLASLRRTLRRLDMAAAPILWLFSYEWGEYLGHLGEKLTIYHAVDEYSAYELEYAGPAAAARRRLIQQLEAETIARVDMVFVTSAPLLAAKQPLHPHITLVENGVDYDHFAAPGAAIPAEMAALPRPRIVYAGAVNEKLDLSLLQALAARFPHFSFILIGPIALRYDREQLAQVQALPNVHFLGHKPVAELPAYLHACDVCIMPYKRNEWTRQHQPAETVRISGDRPAHRLHRHPRRPPLRRHHLAGAMTPAAFIAALEAALAADTPDRRRRQQALARQHTWDNRIEALSTAISRQPDPTRPIHMTTSPTPSPSYLRIIARRWWLILLLPLVTAAVIFTLSRTARVRVPWPPERLQIVVVDSQEVAALFADALHRQRRADPGRARRVFRCGAPALGRPPHHRRTGPQPLRLIESDRPHR